jgi:predicted ATPase
MLKGMTHFFYGELPPAKAFLEKTVVRYDIDQFGNHCYLYGQDPGMVASSYLALTLAFQDDIQKALELSDRCLTETRALKHPFSLAYGLTFAAWLKLFLERTDEGSVLAEEALALCEQQHIGIFLGMARVLSGWVLYQQRRFDEAVRDIRSGIDRFDALGAGVLMPFWHGLLSQAELETGDHERALAAANRALSLATSRGEHWSSAELHRLRARVLLRTNPDSADAESALHDAIELARRQGAVLFEQRAITELRAMGKTVTESRSSD